MISKVYLLLFVFERKFPEFQKVAKKTGHDQHGQWTTYATGSRLTTHRTRRIWVWGRWWLQTHTRALCRRSPVAVFAPRLMPSHAMACNGPASAGEVPWPTSFAGLDHGPADVVQSRAAENISVAFPKLMHQGPKVLCFRLIHRTLFP